MVSAGQVSLRDQLRSLMAARDALEAEVAEHTASLQRMGIGMKDPLIDQEACLSAVAVKPHGTHHTTRATRGQTLTLQLLAPIAIELLVRGWHYSKCQTQVDPPSAQQRPQGVDGAH